MPDSLSQAPQPVRAPAASMVLALVALIIGGAALLGWILNNEFLKRIHSSLVTMKANTAVCLILVSLSLLLIQDRPPSLVKRRFMQLSAIIVASLA